MIRLPMIAALSVSLLSVSGCGDSPEVETGLDALIQTDGEVSPDIDGIQDGTIGPQDGVGDAAIPVDNSAGRVTWRRLNRAEYNNTVRDLLWTTLTPAVDFPADDTGYGFDNIANVLSLSALHLELYESAAWKLAADATKVPIAEPVLLLMEAESPEVTATTGKAYGDIYNLWSNGQLTATFQIPATGEYLLRARVWGQQAGPDWVKLGFVVDGALQEVVELGATQENPAVIEHTVQLAEGTHFIGLEFLNDYYMPDLNEDRNLIIDWISVEGPMDAPDPADWPHTKIFSACDPGVDGPEPCATQILGKLAKRAWRRPVTEAELDGLVALAKIPWNENETFEEGIEVALAAILLSPHFIFRTEFNDVPTDANAEALTDYEIATRLSYLLWSSMPDDTLLDAADEGLLQDPEGIEFQVRRMLQDPKAAALTDNFAGQWLFIRDIDNVFPDTWIYPAFDEPLRAAMTEEMLRFFHTFVTEDRSMIELLTAETTWVNERLALHYGLEGVTEEEGWKEVSLEGTGRRGLLTQAGILTVLSTPFRTSIVRRGKWVLEQLLCEGPPPPPPGAEAGLEQAEGEEPKTLREMMEQHASDPECVVCHQLMDPIGFGLENFDGIGQWRDEDNGFPIDASGALPGDISFDGPEELIALLSEDERLTGCVVEKAFIYALGRGFTSDDTDTLTAIEASFEASGFRFEELLVAITTSKPFRYRAGEPETEEGR